MTQKLFILSFNSYKRLGYLHRQLEGFTPTLSLPSYLIIPVFSLPPNLFHHSWSLRHSYRQSFRHLLSVTNSKQKDNILVFNTFPYRHITDMSPTFISDIYIGITATITATLPPKRNLRRHLHRQNCINLQRSQTNCKLITFPKLSQKKEESGDYSKKTVYTLLYKDSTSTVLNIQSRC